MIAWLLALLLLLIPAAQAQQYLNMVGGAAATPGGGGGGPPPVTCPQGGNYVDGCSASPSGTAQFPNILAGYAKRPPWNVAGVDYYVGVPSGTSLQDPAIGPLPSGCSYASNTVTCSSGSPTLNGWDFSLHNGITLNITGGSTITVENSKFVIGSNQLVPSGGNILGNAIVLSSGSYNTVFLNNEIDGANAAVTAQVGQTVTISNTGTNTFQYNYFHNSGGDIIDFNTGTRTDIVQYNVFKDTGVNTGHADTLQWFGSIEQNDVISFNLNYQTALEVAGAGMGMMSLFGEGSGSNLTNSKLANNTVIMLASCSDPTANGGNGTGCNWGLTLELDEAAIGDHDFLQDNYIDPTGAVNYTGMWLYPNKSNAGIFPNPSVVTGTVNMVTGQTYTNYPSTAKYTAVPDANNYTPNLSDVYSVVSNPAPNATVTVGGTPVTFTVSLDEAYTITGGTPSLTLTGGRVATLTSGAGTNSLVFTYTTTQPDNANNLAITSFNTNGATIKDSVGNIANMSAVPQTFVGLNIAVPGVNCPNGTAYVDGCPGAPTGTPQFSTILSSYAKRPPWNVPGVDYYAGIPSGTSLQDPTIGPLPSGCGYAAAVVTCSSGSPTLNGWDFSLHNGTTLKITGGGTITVENSKFAIGSNQLQPVGGNILGQAIVLNSGSYNTLFLNNEIDGTNSAVTAQQGQTVWVGNTGTNTFQYNYFHNSGGDIIDFVSGTRTDIVQYNIFKDTGVNTAHADTLQWFGSIEQNGVISFNLNYQTVLESADAGAGMGQMSLFGEGSGSNLTNSKLSNNTVILLASCSDPTANNGNGAGCNWGLTLELDAGAVGDHDILQDNYIDPTGAVNYTGMWLFPVKYYSATFPSPATVAGNVNMVTGQTYTSYPAAQSYTVVPDVNGYTPPMSDVYTTTSSPASGTVTTGSITITMAMDQVYTVSGGTPSLGLNVTGRSATLTSGSGTKSFVFTYAVQAGDSVNNLTVTSFNLNGATIKDGAGNPVVPPTVPITFTGLSVAGSGGGGSCPQGTTYADGCAGASNASVQYPSMLTSYAKRPPWNVAGVDYAVGVPSNVSLKDPAAGGLPSQCSYNSGSFTVSCSGTFTLTGWDFSLHGGTKIYISSGSGWTITQNNFGMSTNCDDPMIDARNVQGNVTISYNTIDDGGAICTTPAGQGVNGSPGAFNTTFYMTMAGGTVTAQYNWIKNIWGDGFDFLGSSTTSSTVLKYNLFDTQGWGGHPDGTQYGGGSFSNTVLSFNTYRQPNPDPPLGPGNQPFHTEAQQTGTITGNSTDHNTLVVPGGNTASLQDIGQTKTGYNAQGANELLGCKQDAGSNTQTGYVAYMNYVDATGATSIYVNSCGSGATFDGGGASFDMVTGATPTHP